jgi:hypothetical protein
MDEALIQSSYLFPFCFNSGKGERLGAKFWLKAFKTV